MGDLFNVKQLFFFQLVQGGYYWKQKQLKFQDAATLSWSICCWRTAFCFSSSRCLPCHLWGRLNYLLIYLSLKIEIKLKLAPNVSLAISEDFIYHNLWKIKLNWNYLPVSPLPSLTKIEFYLKQSLFKNLNIIWELKLSPLPSLNKIKCYLVKGTVFAIFIKINIFIES